MGMSGMIDYAYAYIYTDMDRLDSAQYYYQRALPLFTQQLSNANKINFFSQYAKYQFKAKNYDQAISLLNEANVTAKQMHDLEWQQVIYKQLDSAYQLKGDYKTAMQFAGISQQLKDTLTLLGREEDIMQLQIADEDERQARQLKEAEDSRRRRHQFQYFAITIGIASLFFLLVLMGTFRVSATTIRIVGFFTFLMFFEFLFLVFKKNIYSITDGEPWKDLAFMIGIAALLLPLHHWVEHKVIHYLTTRHLIKVNPGRYFIRKILKRKKDTPAGEIEL
jgi:tetratricopeptide (TPR) repeat protein